jgi:hypothetical protein
MRDEMPAPGAGHTGARRHARLGQVAIILVFTARRYAGTPQIHKI